MPSTCGDVFMNSKAPAFLKSFPRARYHSEHRLAIWRLRGVLNDALADQVVRFIELQEFAAGMPFDRFIDLSGLTQIRLQPGHIFDLAGQLPKGQSGQPVKSALFSDQIVGLGLARMFEDLMRNAASYVRAFQDLTAAARWLGVPPELLRSSQD